MFSLMEILLQLMFTYASSIIAIPSLIIVFKRYLVCDDFIGMVCLPVLPCFGT